MTDLEKAARRAGEILDGATLDTAEWDHLRDYLAEQAKRDRLDRMNWAFNIGAFALLMMSAALVALS